MNMQKTTSTPTPTSHITKDDLKALESTIKDALKANQGQEVDKRYLDLLEKIVQTINELRLTVEFDHERRLQAIEEFLQDM